MATYRDAMTESARSGEDILRRARFHISCSRFSYSFEARSAMGPYEMEARAEATERTLWEAHWRIAAAAEGYREDRGLPPVPVETWEVVVRVTGRGDITRTLTAAVYSPMGAVQAQVAEELGIEKYLVHPVTYRLVEATESTESAR